MSAHSAEHINAYCNLIKFLYYRGFELEAEPLRPDNIGDADLRDGRTPTEIVSGLISKFKYWVMVARKQGDRGRAMVIYLLTLESDIAHSSEKFRSELGTAQTNWVKGGGKLAEVIILAPEKVVGKKNLIEIVTKLRADKDLPLYYMYPYCKFATVVPEMQLVPRHEVVPKSEAQVVLTKFHLTVADLPRLIVSASDTTQADAAAIWCGARPGDIVQVHRISETAVTETPVLRYCV